MGRYRRYSKERIGNSGLPASVWAGFGIEIGKLMRRNLRKGKCDKCNFFKSRIGQLSPRHRAEFERCWGKDHDEEKSCLLTPEEYYANCPVTLNESEE